MVGAEINCGAIDGAALLRLVSLQMKIAKSLLAGLAFAWLSSVPGDAVAQLAKVTTSYVSDSAGVLPLWLAKEAGIFARNGLEVQAVRVHAAVGVMALMSGELQFTLASGPVVVESALRGSNTVYVAGGMSTLDFVLVTRPEIKTSEQLRGGTVGLSAIRGANPTATRFALQKLGLGPKDVSFIVVGGTSERIAGLRLGKIHGTLFSPPQNITAQREGFNALADVAELGLPFVHIGVATTRAFIREKPELVRRYVKSHVEAIALMKTDRELAIKVLGKYLGQIKDRDVLAKSYEAAAPDNRISRKQYPNPAGIQIALDLLADENPKAKSARPEEFVDTRFIKELDDSGYIDSLYKPKPR
jgi:NitT/TauT family transport system substrate-binding protein